MNKILVVTGEESGDKQFSIFWKKLPLSQTKDLELWGVGGSYFKSIGGKVVFPQERLSVMGMVEVLSRLREIREAEKIILTHPFLDETRLVFLVDFPGFNFRIGKKLAAKGKKIVYFIPPKVWVWGKNRVNKMKRFVSLVLYIFPFEKKIYEEAGIPAMFVGNPAVQDFVEKTQEIDFERTSILLLPGSREFEVVNLFPLMLKTVKVLNFLGFKYDVVVPAASSIPTSLLEKIIFKERLCIPVRIERDEYKRLLMSGKIAFAASGSVNLELAAARVPQIVGYKVSPITYKVGKKLVSIPYVSPVNILSGIELVPELLQENYNIEELVNYAKRMLEESDYRDKIIDGYDYIVSLITKGINYESIAYRIVEMKEKES